MMPRSSKKYVCGFYGARDGYEVALALHEAGWLEVLLTDFYGENTWLKKLGLARVSRSHPKLPPEKVCGSPWLSVAKMAAARVFPDAELQNHLTDYLLSRRIGRAAVRNQAHIFTYEPYAVRRPNGGFSQGRKQILFHFHPHVDMEDAIYAEDQRRFPEFYRELKVTESPYRKRTADAWRQADLILCASSFTRDSLVAAGMPKEMCRVVPYGVKSPDAGNGASRQGPLKLLFVGRNPLRKGLHHLILAWQEAKKRPADRLTIVCAGSGRAVRELAVGQEDVAWKEYVSGEELTRLYREADALVVPSLCEGFGHVYLEAMGHGCAVVGTAHSALPDLGGEKDGVFLVPVGQPGKLADLISRASIDPGNFRSKSEAARKRAGEFTWEKFRGGIREAVKSLV